MFENGHLYECWLEAGQGLKRREVIYAHLQKRKMCVKNVHCEGDSFLILPNRMIVPKNNRLTERQLICGIRWARFRALFKPDEITHHCKDFIALWKHRYRKYILHRV